jgi:hypothetical protein
MGNTTSQVNDLQEPDMQVTSGLETVNCDEEQLIKYVATDPNSAANCEVSIVSDNPVEDQMRDPASKPYSSSGHYHNASVRSRRRVQAPEIHIICK